MLKKLIIAFVLVMLAAGTGFADDSKTPVSTNPVETPEVKRSRELLNRLEEIKAMDLKSLPKAEKRKLRKEVREIKREVNNLNGGVYISLAGIIIILLLLILLL